MRNDVLALQKMTRTFTLIGAGLVACCSASAAQSSTVVGGSGGVTYVYLVPPAGKTAAVTIDDSQAHGKGTIYVGDTQLTGVTTAGSNNVWTADNGTQYQFTPSTAAGIGTLTVTRGLLGGAGNEIIIQSLDLNQAQTTGYLGIHLGTEKIALVPSDNLSGNADLAKAAAEGNAKEVARLLDGGANIESRDQFSLTPLHEAVASGHKDVVELLIARGANVNTTRRNWTPLKAAAAQGRTDLVALLIAHGASVNFNAGSTALLDATIYGHKDVIALLIASGADVNAKSSSGGTPLHVAADEGGKKNYGDYEYNDIALMLVKAGADLSAKNGDGKTPLDLAVASGNTNFVALFSPMPDKEGPSFICADSAKLTVVESDICASPRLSRLDRQMNNAYLAALTTTRSPARLKTEQRFWLQQRDQECNHHSASCSVDRLLDMYERRIILLKLAAVGSGSYGEYEPLPIAKPLQGKTPEDRVIFLKTKLAGDDVRESVEQQIPYVLGGLQDSSPKVRETAAYFLIHQSLLPKMIHVMAGDFNHKVRQSAAMGISQWITDNGADDCNSVDVVVKNIDELLLGLRDDSTFEYVVEVLGSRYAGSTPLPCCMASSVKERVVASLRSYRSVPPAHTIASYFSLSFVDKALGNIAECSANNK